MHLRDALCLLAARRGDAIVVACEGNRHPWADASGRPEFDIPFADCMGKGSSLALGIALARPDVKVMVLDGDGSLLTNLGTLVTVAGKAPPNLLHFVVEDGVYGERGGQRIPNRGALSFTGLARAAGYAAVHEFDDLEDLALMADEVMAARGPVFVCLKVQPLPPLAGVPSRPEPMLRESLDSVRAGLARASPRRRPR